MPISLKGTDMNTKLDSLLPPFETIQIFLRGVVVV